MSTVKRKHKVKAVVLTVGGDVEILDLSDNSMHQIQDAVGGYFQVIGLSDKLNLWCNEDGKSMELAHNKYGQAVWEDYYGFTDYLAGNVVLTGGANADGDTISLTHKQIADILLVVHEAASNGISYAAATVNTEQLQEDLLCYFDGISEEVLDKFCKIVIDTIKVG